MLGARRHFVVRMAAHHIKSIVGERDDGDTTRDLFGEGGGGGD